MQRRAGDPLVGGRQSRQPLANAGQQGPGSVDRRTVGLADLDDRTRVVEHQADPAKRRDVGVVDRQQPEVQSRARLNAASDGEAAVRPVGESGLPGVDGWFRIVHGVCRTGGGRLEGSVGQANGRPA